MTFAAKIMLATGIHSECIRVYEPWFAVDIEDLQIHFHEVSEGGSGYETAIYERRKLTQMRHCSLNTCWLAAISAMVRS
jgi:hypothetical protein